MRVLDLFSGIGGFSLGLERAGMKTIAFCEIDPFCRNVLARHWPDVPVYEDVTKLCRRLYDCLCPRCGVDFGECACIGTDQFLDEVGQPDLICGGFPCQDISLIGKREGIHGKQSGLWTEFRRIICELEPRIVLLENVSALTHRGLDTVLGDLAEIGYDAEWHCIPASSVGAPHRRDRIWIMAHPVSTRLEGHPGYGPAIRKAISDGPTSAAHIRGGEHAERRWPPEPAVGRVAHGISGRVDRLKALGNAVVPQVVEAIGRAIMATESDGRDW